MILNENSATQYSSQLSKLLLVDLFPPLLAVPSSQRLDSKKNLGIALYVEAVESLSGGGGHEDNIKYEKKKSLIRTIFDKWHHTQLTIAEFCNWFQAMKDFIQVIFSGLFVWWKEFFFFWEEYRVLVTCISWERTNHSKINK